MLATDIDVGTWTSETDWDETEPVTGTLVLVGTLNGKPTQYSISVACPYEPSGHKTIWGRFSW